ncbi:MAG: DNA gyrase inhibitor YacG [Rhodocyclaceae bacterium]|nr:DNA gyrase inhibitor YacG [Rhodocyclaceae bacterium]MBX3667891.1 DNA gyrase inhibitor YacG [Rhodocyclaceae bacterium]
MSHLHARSVTCPTCNKTVEWSSRARWRPFCSERCKLIDLGQWANERYRVAGDDTQEPAHETSSDVTTDLR